MKKRILNIVGIVVFTLTAFTACDENFLELSPPTSLSPAQALKSAADLQVAVRGVYAQLRATDFYGRTVPVLGDIMADNAYQHATNTNRYTLFNNYQAVSTDGNGLGLWNSAYTAILRANNIINADVPSSAEVAQYKGEAYALRALSYFTIIRYFARPYTDNPNALGVPIVLEYNADLFPARKTVEEVYALILADLTQAYTLMTSFTNSSQFSKYAARALAAKVHLTMGNNTAALTALRM